MKRSAVILLAFVLTLCAAGQEPTVIKDYGGKRVVQDPSQYKLVGSSEHKVVIQHYELISDSERDKLVDLIIQDIDYYLDRVMEIDEGKMVVRKSDKQIMKDLESIVDHKIKLYDYQVDEDFEGFSAAFEEKIKSIERLNWSTQKVEDGNSSYDGREMAMNYVQSQIGELKDISTNDLRLFAEEHIHEYTGLEIPEDMAFDPGPIDTGEWIINSPLVPIDFSLASISEQDIGLFVEPESAGTEIPQGTDSKIVELLESNNKLIQTFGEQMLAMQQEMLDIRKESIAFQNEFRDIRGDINDLQLAISEIQESNTAVLENPNIRPLTGEDSYVLRFEKNSDHISLPYQMELNEVYHLLMLDRNRKVMITGYADISGTPELNAQISRMRALSVKHYLRQKGVPSNRMIINFVGDSVSDSENPMDRKVEIAWLGN